MNKFKYYRQSPFYNLLKKVAEIVEVMLILVEYLKTDRRGRFDLSHLEHLYQLLKYYLLVYFLLFRKDALSKTTIFIRKEYLFRW